MKTITAIAAAAALAVTAPAQASKLDNFCIGVSQLAEHTMTARQGGLPMALMLKTQQEELQAGNLTPEEVELLKQMAIDAYQVPDFSGYPSEVPNQVREFSNKWMTWCYQEVGQ